MGSVNFGLRFAMSPYRSPWFLPSFQPQWRSWFHEVHRRNWKKWARKCRKIKRCQESSWDSHIWRKNCQNKMYCKMFFLVRNSIFRFNVQRHRPVDQGQPAMLDFASVQQMLQYTSAAQATDDLTPFLSESQKSPPLLLRGPVPASVWRLWRDVCVMVFDFAPMSLIIPSCVKFLYLLGGLTYHSNKPAKFRRAKHNSYPRKTWRFCRVFPIRTPRIHFICKTSWGSFEKLWWIETWKNFPGWYFYKLIEVRLSYF